MKTIITLALLIAMSASAQSKKPCTIQDLSGCEYGMFVDGFPDDYLPVASCPSADPANCWTVGPGPSTFDLPMKFSDSIKDGVYKAVFEDDGNKWRCYPTAFNAQTVTIVCVKSHDVLEKKGKP